MEQFFGVKNIPVGHTDDSIIPGCIVLEGGAFRVLYSEGVLDALMEENINLDTTIGVSGGAMNGVNYVSGQIGRSARLNLSYRHDSNYVGTKAYAHNDGIIGFDFLFKGKYEQEEPWDIQSFYRKERRFIVVATNVETGKPEFLEKGECIDIARAVQASASMPFLSKPVELEGKQYLDGGCSLNIPYQWAIEEGFDRIVVVRTRDRLYRKNSHDHKLLNETYYRQYPQLADALSHSHERYNEECDKLDALEKAGRIFVIAPSDPVDVSRLEGNMDKLGQLYYMGYEDAKGQMKALKAYLGI